MNTKCTRCEKEFKLIKSSKSDGLCGKCRSREKYLSNPDKYRKSNTCVCGKKILVTSTKCSSCSQTGNKNHNYIHGNASKLRKCSNCGCGISVGSKKGFCQSCYFAKRKAESNRIYNIAEYKDWRSSVYKRDDYRCKVCYSNKDLNAHHIYPKQYHIDKVFELDNGITLCGECHRKTYRKEYEYVPIFEKIVAEVKSREFGEPYNMGIPSQAIEEIH